MVYPRTQGNSRFPQLKGQESLLQLISLMGSLLLRKSVTLGVLRPASVCYKSTGPQKCIHTVHPYSFQRVKLKRKQQQHWSENDAPGVYILGGHPYV